MTCFCESDRLSLTRYPDRRPKPEWRDLLFEAEGGAAFEAVGIMSLNVTDRF
jgi:hypothetical protein